MTGPGSPPAAPRSLPWADLAAWYLAMLAPTLYVKYRYMMVLSRWWMTGGSSEKLTDGEPLSTVGFWLTHVAPPDVIEVAVLVLVAYLVGHVVLRLSIRVLAMGSVAVAMAGLALTLLAIRETGSLLTINGVQSAVDWLRSDPRMLRSGLTLRHLLLVAAGVGWLAAPRLFGRVFARLGGSTRSQRLLVPGALALLLAAAIVARPDALTTSAGVGLSRGLWSSAALRLARERADLARVPVRPPLAIRDGFRRIVYPAGRPEQAPSLIEIPADRKRARHVLMVMLETAPLEFYPLLADDLPAFSAMRRHAIVSERHYAAAPRSDLAVYSLVSGTYPRPGRPIYAHGAFATDGLAATLRGRGYETTFVDSTDVKSYTADQGTALQDLGFARVVERREVPAPVTGDAYGDGIARERASLTVATDAILDAERHGRKALVSVMTTIGHFPWVAPAGIAPADAAARLRNLARGFDQLLAEARGRLAAAHLDDDVIVAVVGDHGFRFGFEFWAVGQPLRFSELMFNVPLIISAPGVVEAEVRVPWATSHVDVAPTILNLLGMPTDDQLMHGESMLDGRLASRVTVLPSGMFEPMYPVDGLRYRGDLFAWAFAVDRVRTWRVDRPDGVTVPGVPMSVDDARARLQALRPILNETASLFLQRRDAAAR